MSLTTAAQNTMLDALTITDASLHDGFPGLTGASEIAGGSYAREAITFAAASGSSRVASSVTFDVPACTVRWVGFWNSSTFIGYAPSGGTPKEFVCTPSTDTITCTAHGFIDTDTIVFFKGTVPTGLTEGTVYYVRDATTDTFKVAATAGGAAIDLTGAGSTDCQVSLIVQETYAGAATHELTTCTIGLPF